MMSSEEILTAEVLPAEPDEDLAKAQELNARIHKAAGIAKFNGWTTGIIALCAAPVVLFSLSLVGVFITIGLAVVAYNELRWRKRLLAIEPPAATLLGWNQVAFLTMILIYCGCQLYFGLNSSQKFAEELANYPEYKLALEELGGGDLDQLYRWLVMAVYIPVIILSIIFQGWNALYYFGRKKLVDRYLELTQSSHTQTEKT